MSSSNKSATANRPSGKSVIGTGGEIVTFGGGGQVAMDELDPNNSLTGWFEDQDGVAGDWLMQASAICATA